MSRSGIKVLVVCLLLFTLPNSQVVGARDFEVVVLPHRYDYFFEYCGANYVVLSRYPGLEDFVEANTSERVFRSYEEEAAFEAEASRIRGEFEEALGSLDWESLGLSGFAVWMQREPPVLVLWVSNASDAAVGVIIDAIAGLADKYGIGYVVVEEVVVSPVRSPGAATRLARVLEEALSQQRPDNGSTDDLSSFLARYSELRSRFGAERHRFVVSEGRSGVITVGFAGLKPARAEAEELIRWLRDTSGICGPTLVVHFDHPLASLNLESEQEGSPAQKEDATGSQTPGSSLQGGGSEASDQKGYPNRLLLATAAIIAALLLIMGYRARKRV